MVKNQRKSTLKKGSGNISAFAKKEFAGALIYIFIFSLSSLVAVLVDLDAGQVFYISLTAFAVASFFFAYVSVLKERKNGLLLGILFTLPLNLGIIFVSLILCGFKADFHLLISTAVLLITSAFGGVLSVNRKIKK